MKKTFTITLILLGCMTAIGQTKRQYHIRVDSFTRDSYVINYTVDNWKTQYHLMCAFDLSDIYRRNYICNQELIFNEGDCQTNLIQAVAFAQRFKTYNDCLVFNTNVRKRYLSLIAYRKSHPVKMSSQPSETVCNKTIQIY